MGAYEQIHNTFMFLKQRQPTKTEACLVYYFTKNYKYKLINNNNNILSNYRNIYCMYNPVI